MNNVHDKDQELDGGIVDEKLATGTPQPGARKEMPLSPPSNTFIRVALLVIGLIGAAIVVAAIY